MRHLLVLALVLPMIANAAITAKSYIVTDMHGTVLLAENADEERPIASITKLITVERNAPLPRTDMIEITKDDIHSGRMRSSPLRAGESYSREQLMQLALVSSDNVAAIALGRSAPEMLLPPKTTIIEASGLDSGNRSTAREVANFARGLYNGQSELATMASAPYVQWGKRAIRSTNKFIDKPGWTFGLSKTGFTNPAGGCLVVVTQVGQRLLTIAILGSTSVPQRWKDLAEIRTQLGDTGFYQPPVQVFKKRKRRR